MAQGKVRTLINLLVVFGLLGVFLWGGSHLLNAVTGSDQAAAAPLTMASVVEQPGAFGTATATPRGGAHTPTPLPSPTMVPPTDTPAPTPTPNAPPKVIMSTSILGTNPSTKFTLPGGPLTLNCLARNSALPPHTNTLLFTWIKDTPPPYFSYSEGPSGAAYSYTFDPISVAGTYRCDVYVNGSSQLFGSAQFTVTQ